eukprot:366470-Chlamydomonas_euryale.AAC.10
MHALLKSSMHARFPPCSAHFSLGVTPAAPAPLWCAASCSKARRARTRPPALRRRSRRTFRPAPPRPRKVARPAARPRRPPPRRLRHRRAAGSLLPARRPEPPGDLGTPRETR